MQACVLYGLSEWQRLFALMYLEVCVIAQEVCVHEHRSSNP